eukprot:CAMPEP_0172498090 /NCGR_PEP_ID=MMETSP1066-20121228/109188_1 /TAXON_ID=671091 /ORGANISM="Coscinodiscus wailesii, Strain CCMP2513" /LENGTH=78 /DNA_ID=CAMNT_0013271219 /DNA_START=91 /DNA_END=327 /DNA_ORIENTATION=-
MTDENTAAQEGSWKPSIIVVAVIILFWLGYGQGNVPMRFRRWYNIQRISWKKKLGYRDESNYKMSAGDGANQKYKRQG